ncbi:bifunctional hydroxymethylpyrimidine kinase/phosphomethylpyrimidine kinase [Patescibacteria group bacterium]|nr:bifunctional hydroxymethylpyrimidine kinase/phosphomethylpyrimidine kinase [Patescibacteria group bacterium]
MPQFSVVTIGAAVQDIFLLSEAFQVIRSAQFAGGLGECVALGSKIGVEKLVIASGGGATNAAATFAALGNTTAICARIGDDAIGRDIVDDLLKRRIETRLIKKVSKEQTGTSVLLTVPNGERSVLTYRGASASFKNADLSPACFDTTAIYVTSLGGNAELLSTIAKRAKAKKVVIAVNPGMGEIKQLRLCKEALANATVTIVNTEEAQTLLESKQKDPVELAKALKKITSPVVIVTDGPNGAAAIDDTGTYFVKTTGKKSISRTGAGDAFGSGTVAGLVKGLTLSDALKIGTLNAENVIQHFGAKAGILKAWPNKKALERVIVRQVR